MSKSRMLTTVSAVQDSDRLVAEKIEQALWHDSNIHRSNDAEIEIQYTAGLVRMCGYVGTNLGKMNVEDVVRRQPKVVQIENHLVVDDELMYQVAQTLGSDARMNGEQLVVRAHRGFIFLSGTASSSTLRLLAAEITVAMPHVRGIVNRVQAPGIVTDAEEDRILQPSIGLEIFTTDGGIGHIQQVIINPHNRRVTALVALVDFSTSQFPTSSRSNNQQTQPKRTIIIPVTAIRHAPKASVFLGVSSENATRFPDINSADFTLPPTDWQPPYPYHRTDILLTA